MRTKWAGDHTATPTQLLHRIRVFGIRDGHLPAVDREAPAELTWITCIVLASLPPLWTALPCDVPHTCIVLAPLPPLWTALPCDVPRPVMKLPSEAQKAELGTEGVEREEVDAAPPAESSKNGDVPPTTPDPVPPPTTCDTEDWLPRLPRARGPRPTGTPAGR